MNVDRLLAVREMILRYPENFDVLGWSNGTVVADKHAAPACGTTACIAGWALAMRDGAFNEAMYFVNDKNDVDFYDNLLNLKQEAADYLGIDVESADKLFVGHFWDEDLKTSYLKEKDPKIRADIAAARIDRYILSAGQR